MRKVALLAAGLLIAVAPTFADAASAKKKKAAKPPVTSSENSALRLGRDFLTMYLGRFDSQQYAALQMTPPWRPFVSAAVTEPAPKKKARRKTAAKKK